MYYTVGEIARISGIPAHTLRYYDREGLLPGIERSEGGIRRFKEEDFQTLFIIECLKSSGLSIKEIRRYMELAEAGMVPSPSAKRSSRSVGRSSPPRSPPSGRRWT